jgi:tetraacyldisaccharide 4'-kinase
MNATASVPSGFTADDRRGAWFAVISGERRGPAAALARLALSLLAGLYRAGLAVHDLKFLLPGAVKRAPCPVVSVGNLTVGGTGKTPMVAYLARLAAEMGRRPVIVSRGYGAKPGRPNEEAMELSALCPGVPHLQHSDRWRAIRGYVAQNPCDLAVLDDGFQHRRLARDLDIVLIDALQPFGLGASGFGRLLPRGLLREPLAALRRADLAVITRADLADDLARLKRTLAAHLRPDVPVLAASHRPAGVVTLDGTRHETAWLRGRDVAAACGIGNPEAFRWTLGQAGARVRRFEMFPDHHAYTRDDLDRLVRAARAAGLEALVTTGKDFVKWLLLLEGGPAPQIEIAAMEVAFCVTEGEEALRDRLASLFK